MGGRAASGSKAQNSVREQLTHPVIDSDGHMIESMPTFFGALDEVGGPRAVDKFREMMRSHPVGSFGDKEKGEARGGFWGFPSDARDVATAMVPSILCDRLDELGFDFAVVLPSLGIPLMTIPDPEVRVLAVRAENLMNSVLFEPYRRRMTPAACIPMGSPDEAIEELRYAKGLGLKTGVIPAGFARPIPAHVDAFPAASFIDHYGLDSAYDYDPFWKALLEAEMPITSHIGVTLRYLPSGRQSPSNFCFNHIGAHAFAMAELSRSLLMGGVLQRVPNLTIGLLEGGVSWACDMVPSVEDHWKKRGLDALLRNLDPSKLDEAVFQEQLADANLACHKRFGVDQIIPQRGNFTTSTSLGTESWSQYDNDQLDEWKLSGIGAKGEATKAFSKAFFFGCEGDDRTLARTFDDRRKGYEYLKPIYGSDIGHYDVPSMKEVLSEAFELVEDGLIEPNDFEDFVYNNPVEFWTRHAPTFFSGTIIEEP
jgi:hypothetical protein